MKTKTEFAANVQMRRKVRGMSVEQLAAEMAGRGFEWTEDIVRSVENDRRRVDVFELYALTNVLGLSSPDQLVGSLHIPGYRNRDRVIDLTGEDENPFVMGGRGTPEREAAAA